MPSYRKTATKVWNDKKFRSLSGPNPNAQTLWLYLLTGSNTIPIPGVIPCGPPSLFDALRWPQDQTSYDCFNELVTQDLIKFDPDGPLIYIVKTLTYDFNHPDNPNQLIGWGKFWEFVPECELKNYIYHDIKRLAKRLGKGLHEGFAKGFPEGLPEPFAEPVSSKQYPVSNKILNGCIVKDNELNANTLPKIHLYEGNNSIEKQTCSKILDHFQKKHIEKFQRMTMLCDGKIVDKALELKKLYKDQKVIELIDEFFDGEPTDFQKKATSWTFHVFSGCAEDLLARENKKEDQREGLKNLEALESKYGG